MAVYKDNATGTWRVIYRFTNWKGERKQTQKRGFTTKREAQAWEHEVMLKQNSKLDMTFASFFELYEADKKQRVKESTWESKSHVIRTKILPYFGNRKIAEIEAKDIIAWQNELMSYQDEKGKPYSADYLKTIHAQLTAIFNHAVNFYNLPYNPARRAGTMGNEIPKEMDFWTKEEYLKFSEAMMDKPRSFYAFEMLYSTFKIISALLGLQKGVIVDESSTMGYDGMDYGNVEWNGNLTLEEAFEKSCIWYFREVIDLVGRDKMQEELKNLQYGNCDISEWNGSNINPLEKLNGFWLDSSLKISPLEQVEVLSRIFEGHSDYNSRNIEILKRIMLVDENDSQKIYGKTGSGNGEAWFVGFSESDGERKYIAIYLNDSEHRDQISGNRAKEIALEIIK